MHSLITVPWRLHVVRHGGVLQKVAVPWGVLCVGGVGSPVERT